MDKIFALSSVALTVGLAISRPRLGPNRRVGPAFAAAVGVSLMFASGFVRFEDLASTAQVLWQPLIAIGSIMVIAAAAKHLGLLDRVAVATYPLARGSTPRLFTLVFGLSAITAAALNNDSAILLLTPLIVLLVRGVYPHHPDAVVPFVFAVFMAAGVAPLVVSNPMNMIVADYADIGFNEYALKMLPISIVGWFVSYAVLKWIFRRQLAELKIENRTEAESDPLTRSQKQILALLGVVVGSYPIASYFGRPIWLVALVGAGIALVIGARDRDNPHAPQLLRRGVSWETLAFLVGAFVLAIGLRNAGIIEWLSSIYDGAGLAVIGGISAVGSAVINNHSMGLINVLAIQEAPGAGKNAVLAALIGGDLGPRLLPVGSLAGLLWYASLRQLDVEVPVVQFIRVGVAVTVPSLAASLLLLHLF